MDDHLRDFCAAFESVFDFDDRSAGGLYVDLQKLRRYEEMARRYGGLLSLYGAVAPPVYFMEDRDAFHYNREELKVAYGAWWGVYLEICRMLQRPPKTRPSARRTTSKRPRRDERDE